MDADKKNGYIRGCVIKQGNMGHLYCEQGELKMAEKLFLGSLNFILTGDMRLYSTTWNANEVPIAKQIALYNLASLYLKKNATSYAEHYFVMSLMATEVMHLSTTRKACQSLLTLHNQRPGTTKHFQSILDRLGIDCSDSVASLSSQPKRVAFGLDYSGSMSGTKIRSAVDNLLLLFREHINDHDELMIIHFSNICVVDVELSIKEGNSPKIELAISKLVRPSGSTAFYDAIITLYNQFAKNPSGDDWVIVLTDGEDSCSQNNPKSVIATVKQHPKVGIILIGVGDDVDMTALSKLTEFSSKGFVLNSASNAEGIREVFGKVAKLIQGGQVVLEDV